MRKNTKTVSKYYDEQEINGWAVNYQYEAEGENEPINITATGSKEGKSFSVVKTANNMAVNFGNGAEYDGLLIDGISKEITKIFAGFKK